MKIADVMEKIFPVCMFKSGANVINKSFLKHLQGVLP